MNARRWALMFGVMGLLCTAAAPAVAHVTPAAHHVSAKHHARASASHAANGLLRSINVRGHAIMVAVAVTTRHHRSTTTNQAFDISSARVTGASGRIAVGDRLAITWTAVSRARATTNRRATRIRVIGVPTGTPNASGSGASAGPSAAAATAGAITGRITNVDSQNATLTLTNGDDSGAPTVTVDVTSSTIFAVGTQGSSSGTMTLTDIEVGDDVVVTTADLGGDPVVATGVFDSTRPGPNQSDPALPSTPASPGSGGSTGSGQGSTGSGSGGGTSTIPQTGTISGVARRVDVRDDELFLQVGGQSLCVQTSSGTTFSAAVTGVRTPVALASILPNDTLSVTWTSATPTCVNASSIDITAVASSGSNPEPQRVS